MKFCLLLIMLPVFGSITRADDAVDRVDPRVARKFSPFADAVGKVLDESIAKRDEAPLRYLSRDMTVIVGDLSQYQTDHPVQGKQTRVVDNLDELIKKLEKACNGNGGGSLNPTKPLAQSKIVGGPGGVNDLHDPKAGDKMWGQLPAKLREQILQSKTEGFPPGYETLLQSYYRRLSEEKVADDSGAASSSPVTTPPSTQPAHP